MEEHPDNVAVIHCKAGKGRTGTVICCYIMKMGLWDTAEASMTYYAAMRTYNCKVSSNIVFHSQPSKENH